MSQHHDPVHPDSDHLTAELIADLEEGLLDAESAAHARHHLEGCGVCRDLQGQVLGVTLALSQLPELTMPADVEALLIANLPTPATKTIVPIGSAPSRRTGGGLGRILGVAACAAGVMLVGGLVYSTMSNQNPATGTEAVTANSGRATTTPEDIQLASYSATVSGTTYTHDTLGRQATKLMGVAVPATPAATSSVSASPTVSPTDTPTSGDNSTTSSPTQSVLVTKSLPAQVAKRVTLPIVTDPTVAQDCIQNYLQGQVAPLAIDLGMFQGPLGWHPAVIVVLPLADYAHRAEVWVLDPQCKDTIDYATFTLPQG